MIGWALGAYYRLASAARRQTPIRVAFARPWPTRRRGMKLWLIAGALGLRGVLYAAKPSTRSQAFAFPFDWITTQGWGLFVVGCCLVAAISSYCHLGRDRYGYVVLTMLTGAWAASYGYGWAFRDAGDAALQGVLSLGVLTAILFHCAGDPEVSQS